MKSERREEILRAAERLFREHGAGKTTVGDIAREVGIGVGTVYLEFQSKDAIVAALSNSRHDRVVQAMLAVSCEEPALCLERILEERVRVFFALASEGTHACDFVLCQSAQAGVGHFSEAESGLLERVLRSGRDLGVFAFADLAQTSHLVQRACAAYSPPWLFSLDPATAISEVVALARLISRGLLARGD
ncbi:MAG: TetR/AcrR family transcriptional regulator [Polyangiaceae bacterium]